MPKIKPLCAMLTACLSTSLSVQVQAQESTHSLGEVTVTGTREARLVTETPATIDTIKGEAIRERRPAHPKDILNQIPGVLVTNLSGEGHSTAIRHPITTSPVYLYLEDGIPTRSTGFFNHNSLYEINVPQSGGIEVSKGPGSALYGSDAIGGTINVLTRKPPKQAEFELTGEAGQNGWMRTLMSGGNSHGDNAWRANLNLTKTDGWHDHAGYDRQTGSLRWDSTLSGNSLLRVIASFAQINQNHVGDLSQKEYDDTPQKNNAPISYRKVDAFRLSATYENETADSQWSLIPYFRDNSMTIVPPWSLSYDATKYTSENRSIGLLGKYRQDFKPLKARLIVGMDMDYSPGSQVEDKIQTAASGAIKYASFTTLGRIYDYDANFSSVSPYVQGEITPVERLRITAGLRYDHMGYDYKNHLSNTATTMGGGSYGHAADSKTSYHHFSPKLGATYAFAETLSAFAAYNNAFRTPSQGQVFRPSRVFGTNAAAQAAAQTAAQAALNLKPVVVDNFETGLRGQSGKINYELSLYHMTKRDDIVSYKDAATNQTTSVNAGKTLHRGIEFAAGAPVLDDLRVDVSLSYAKHSYDHWVAAVNGANINYSGKEMEAAPRVIGNTRFTYNPGFMNGGRFQLAWTKLGSYWRDAANTNKHDGYNLVNLSASYPFNKRLELYANINNLLDKQYAETSSLSNGAPSYTVGLPRVIYLGVQAKW